MSTKKDPRLKELEEQISLKMKEGKFDEAEKLSSEMIQLAESEPSYVPAQSETDDSEFESNSANISVPIENATTQDSKREDLDNLKLLGLFSYIWGGISFLFGFFPIFHVAFGAMMIFNPGFMSSSGSGVNDPSLPYVGWTMLIIGLSVMLGFWIYSACMVYAGRCLRGQRRYTYSLVMAIISCLHMPLGTVLGIFTIIVLRKPSVKQLYGRAST